MSSHNHNTQIAIIDRAVEDHLSLVSAAQSLGMEVIILSGQGDGFIELAEALTGRSGIDGLHLFSHGSPGKIHLGQSAMHSGNLEQYADTLAVIKASLSDNGDVLIYGCDVAGTEAGVEFVRQLSVILDADVAASVDLTGNEQLGGNWVLEFLSGTIESEHIAPLEYSAILATPSSPTYTFAGETSGPNHTFITAD